MEIIANRQAAGGGGDKGWIWKGAGARSDTVQTQTKAFLNRTLHPHAILFRLEKEEKTSRIVTWHVM